MGKKCEVVDNGSSRDQNSRNADVSTDILMRSDVKLEIAQAPLKEKRKTPSESGTKEISHVPHKQRKPDSLSPEPYDAVESKKVLQGPGVSKTKKSDPNFDLNEETEANEPIPVVAKLGVPKGLPVKPLSFGGEHGWNRSGINSAFREKKPVSRGFNFDLNITATMDPPEVLSVPCNSGIDLNNDPIIEDAGKVTYPQGETWQLLPNCNILDSGTRAPYWVDFSSVRGRPFLMGPPTTEQAQMMVPIQMPYTPPGLYIGKMNGFTPAFYPPNTGPQFLAYPGSVRPPENSPPYSNTGPAIFQNGSRNHLFEQRLKPADQAACPTLSMTRREIDTRWVASQVTQTLL